MKTIQPTFPIKSVIFWLIVLSSLFAFASKSVLISYTFGFFPVYLFSLIFRHYTNNIVISDNILTTKINFDKFQIDLDKVKSFEVKKKSLLLQLLFGLPKEVTQVEYNKYDTLQLNSADSVLLEALSRNDKV